MKAEGFTHPLPPNARTIDAFNPTSGKVISIKSRDMTRSTYLNKEGFERQMRADADKLKGYNGDTAPSVDIDPVRVKFRDLEVVVPQGKMTNEQRAWFKALKDEYGDPTKTNPPVNLELKDWIER